MARRGLGRLGAVVAALGAVIVGLAASHPAQAGYAALVVDGGTGAVLNAVNPDEENHPASLTKMMTLYLTFEAIHQGRLHWEDELPVSRNAANKEPTKLGLEVGQTVSVKDCVLGMIVISANDGATVVGEALAGGSEQVFARMMTDKAHQLGMTNTVFRNASGLPDREQVTTARDMSRLAMALHRDFPQDYHYFATREFEFEGRHLTGHNRLMYRYPGMDGMKTGFTNASGSNLVSSAVHDGRRLFGVVFGGSSAKTRDKLMETLLDNAFANRDTDPKLVALAAGRPLTRVARARGTGHLAHAGRARRVQVAVAPVQRRGRAVAHAPRQRLAAAHAGKHVVAKAHAKAHAHAHAKGKVVAKGRAKSS
ncbi:D-alanyl-D-alanine carboxypeptidase family protein [Nitrospirillum iridis]|uniref:D-alanyl-D-alanine carboxypeptidase/D-alanyl-D-alanine carboxypeptidase (Penicillin-binding protein 5/6) n=1 Tax=Nitrospirillum iridis TaxID=765888 RepID=A0A7X0AV10_9PROT|nr:D-alanyl-D-alanine carboxypeptidase family protein [Nitrospirillum iridis]MBB6250578.1 D-alanyl-D-alanine carboxypeptidase/D-alanyl-D-alanine carboxypeptidase (penicillin-binding protein 5/6) [Nitrospirillum iridis]